MDKDGTVGLFILTVVSSIFAILLIAFILTVVMSIPVFIIYLFLKGALLIL